MIPKQLPLQGKEKERNKIYKILLNLFNIKAMVLIHKGYEAPLNLLYEPYASYDHPP
jgi:hypothetical protein